MTVITLQYMYAPIGALQDMEKKKLVKTMVYGSIFFSNDKITPNIGKTVYLLVPSRSLRSLSQVAQCHAGNSLRK